MRLLVVFIIKNISFIYNTPAYPKKFKTVKNVSDRYGILSLVY